MEENLTVSIKFLTLYIFNDLSRNPPKAKTFTAVFCSYLNKKAQFSLYNSNSVKIHSHKGRFGSWFIYLVDKCDVQNKGKRREKNPM